MGSKSAPVKLSDAQESPRNLLNADSDPVGLGQSLKFCILISFLVMPLLTVHEHTSSGRGFKDQPPLGSFGMLDVWRFLSLGPHL